MAFDLQKFITIAEFLGPIVLQSVGVKPEIVKLVNHSIAVAQSVDVMSRDGLSGAEKKALAMDIVTTGLNAVNVARPGTVDVDEVMDAVGGGIDATVKAIKAAQNIPVHPADAMTPSVDSAAPPSPFVDPATD